MTNNTKTINHTDKKSWLQKLQDRWGVSAFQVIIILIVFACTGFTVMFLKKPVVAFFTGGEQSMIFTIAYYILILPVYNIILLIYGFIFGQFKFFWEFEKRFFKRMFRMKS